MRQKEDYAKLVYVTHDTEFKGLWDGKEVIIHSEPIKLKLGIVRHFELSGVTFTVSDVPKEDIARKIPENPLQEVKGEAFAGLKRGRKPKGG